MQEQKRFGGFLKIEKFVNSEGLRFAIIKFQGNKNTTSKIFKTYTDRNKHDLCDTAISEFGGNNIYNIIETVPTATKESLNDRIENILSQVKEMIRIMNTRYSEEEYIIEV